MMQTRMVRFSPQSKRIGLQQPDRTAKTSTKKKKQLSKEDEVAAGAGSDNEVRREDQDKINRFSRLHQRETILEGVLKGKQVFLSQSFILICMPMHGFFFFFGYWTN